MAPSRPLCPRRVPSNVALLVTTALSALLVSCQAPTPTTTVDFFTVLSSQVVKEGVLDLGASDDDRWIGTGWNAEEPQARWTSQRDAELTLALRDASARQLFLRVMGSRSNTDPTAMTITVNGFVLPTRTVPQHFEDVHLEVPAGVLHSGYNHLTISCDRTVTSGPRQLGVFVDQIALRAEADVQDSTSETESTNEQQAEKTIELNRKSWIDDQSFTLAGGPMTIDGQYEGATPARIELVEILPDGQSGTVLDRATLEPGAVHVSLAPPHDLDVGQSCRLQIVSDAASADLQIQSITRSVPVRKDILLIVVDTLRADHLGCYGHPTAKTPAIDSLAERGIRFSNVTTHIPITGPSHASYFLSRIPSHTGVVNNHRGVLDPRAPTLAELLRANGYDCRGTISINPIRSRDGFGRGFASYEENLGAAFLRSGELTAAIAESLLTRPLANPLQPRFTLVHLADPHEPYDAHEGPSITAQLIVDGTLRREFSVSDFSPGFLELEVSGNDILIDYRCSVPTMTRRFDLLDGMASGSRLEQVQRGNDRGWVLRSTRPGRVRIAYAFNQIVTSQEERRKRYLREVEATDGEVERVLQALERSGRAEQTWVVFASDHAENLGEKGAFGHVRELYESFVHIPWIICPPPGERKDLPRVDDRLAAPIDLLPTLFTAVGVRVPVDCEGIDLFARRDSRRSVLLETHAPEAPLTKYALRTQAFKLIWTPKTNQYELYDLVQDPGELANLYGDRSPRSHAMRNELDRRVGELLASPKRSVQVLDPETLAALKSLGYID